MKELFNKMNMLVEMGKIQAERLQSKEIVIPEKTEDIKEMIKNKVLELTYKEENPYVKLVKTSNKTLIYDIIMLLYILLDREDDGLGGDKTKEPYPAGSKGGE